MTRPANAGPQQRETSRQSRPSWQPPLPSAAHARTAALLSGLVLLITAASFLPALGNGFVDWDDPYTIEKNTHIRGLGPEQLRWMFSTYYWGHYQPLVWVSYALDYASARALFGEGLSPGVFHLTSVMLHALNTALVLLLSLRLLTARQPGNVPRALLPSTLAALLFGLHPLRVEAVAWATARGDVLVTSFLLLTALAWLRAVRSSTTGAYLAGLAITTVLYTLALLTRGMAVMLPLLLILLDAWPLQRWRNPRAWLEKLPLLALALTFAGVAAQAKAAAGSTIELVRHGLIERLVQACYGIVFYLGKTLVPLRLSPIYELRIPLNVAAPAFVAAVALVAALIVIVALLRRRCPALPTAGLAYALLLAPVLGFGQAGNQLAADRYCYLAAIALVLLVAAGLSRFELPPARIATAAAATVVLVASGLLTIRQIGVWHSTATLWTHAAAVRPESSIAQNGRGFVLLQEQRYAEALPHLRRALELQPANAMAHRNIWRLWRERGRPDEYLAALYESVRLYPNFADAHFSLGLELAQRGQPDAAEKAYAAAIRLRPTDSAALTNRAQLLWRLERRAEALHLYEAATRADARNAIAWRGWAALLYESGRREQALQKLRHALQIQPHDARARQYWQDWTGTTPP